MDEYLGPIIDAASQFLQQEHIDDVPIYLLATGGMRGLNNPQRVDQILQAVHGTLCQFATTFRVDPFNHLTNARVISGKEEGVYGWVALNYGRDQHFWGLLEIGGATMQIAHLDAALPVDPDSTTLVRLRASTHRVWSASWPYGAKLMRRGIDTIEFEDQNPAHGVDVDYNCLPTGQRARSLARENPVLMNIGNGDFAACLGDVQEMFGGLPDPLPSFATVLPPHQHFFGVSNPWYTFKFFAKWGDYELNQAYSRQKFRAAVEKYCTSSWDDIEWPNPNDPDRTNGFIGERCFNAAWLLTVLYHPQRGLYRDRQGPFWFPINEMQALLGERDSWTIGAVALLAQHDDLVFCPPQAPNCPAINVANVNSTDGLSPPPTIQPTLNNVPQFPEAGCAIPLGVNTIFNPSAPSFNLVVYVFALVTLATLAYRRLHRSRSVGSIILVEEQRIGVPNMTAPTRGLLGHIRQGFAISGISSSEDGYILPIDGKESYA